MTECLISMDLKDEILTVVLNYKGGASVPYSGTFSSLPANLRTNLESIDWVYRGSPEHWSESLCGAVSAPPTTSTTVGATTTSEAPTPPTITVTAVPEPIPTPVQLAPATSVEIPVINAEELPFTGLNLSLPLTVAVCLISLGAGAYTKAKLMSKKDKKD